MVPFVADEFGRDERSIIEIAEDLLGDVLQSARGELSDEISLQHGQQERVDLSVLMTVHALDEILDEGQLLAIVPCGEHGDEAFTCSLILGGGRLMYMTVHRRAQTVRRRRGEHGRMFVGDRVVT